MYVLVTYQKVPRRLFQYKDGRWVFLAYRDHHRVSWKSYTLDLALSNSRYMPILREISETGKKLIKTPSEWDFEVVEEDKANLILFAATLLTDDFEITSIVVTLAE